MSGEKQREPDDGERMVTCWLMMVA